VEPAADERPPLVFENRAEHDALVRALVATGAIADMTRVYWDVRLPERVPTIEFRVADVCLTINEAVMLAGLCRGLTRVYYDEARRDAPYARARPELLRAAHWRAARYGLSRDLIDVVNERALPAREHIQNLLAAARPGLEAFGDWDEVSHLVAETLERGTGSDRQRAVYARTGRLDDVVDYIAAETERGTE
jgi:carboxylate-amine ligase